MMAEFDRFAYSALLSRAPLKWPGGARVAVWVCPNIEHYEFLPGPVRVRDPWPRCPHPDVLGYGLKDFGNRVGVWRIFETMDRIGIRCTVSLNLGNPEHYPEIFEACERRSWDYMCHGIYNTQYLWGYSEKEERAFIADCVETFRRLTGRPLEGWFSPAASHTPNTPDLVAAAGIRYFCDFYHDDQPFPVRVKSGQLITIPYQMDLNDAVLHSGSGEGEEFERIATDMFDTLYAEGETHGRVLCVAIHPYISGRPHRLKYVERVLDRLTRHAGVWMTTGREIADWYYSHYYAQVVASLESA
jgi:allantoinase